MKTARAQAAALFVVWLAVLSGCADNGLGGSTPTPTATPTSAPTPTPVPRPQTLEEARSLAKHIFFGEKWNVDRDIKDLISFLGCEGEPSDSPLPRCDGELRDLQQEQQRLAWALSDIQRSGVTFRMRGAVTTEDRILEAHMAGLEDGLVNLCGVEALPSSFTAESVPNQNPTTPEDLEWLREVLFDQWGVITVFDCARDAETMFDWPDIYFSWDADVPIGTVLMGYDPDSSQTVTIWCEVKLNPQLRGTSAGGLVLGALFGHCAGFPLSEEAPSEPPSGVQRAMLYREYPRLAAGP